MNAVVESSVLPFIDRRNYESGADTPARERAPVHQQP